MKIEAFYFSPHKLKPYLPCVLAFEFDMLALKDNFI